MKQVTGNPFTPEQVAARQQAILGAPVRIAPLAELTEEALRVSNHLRATVGSGRPPSTDISDVPEMIAIALKHPDLYLKQIELGIQVNGGAARMPARDREIAILRVAWLNQAPFEWGEHVKIGKVRGGMSDEEVAATIEGSASPLWNDHDRAILQAVEELLSNAYIADATWSTLAQTYDDQQMLELPSLVGSYQATAYIQNSVRYRLTGENVGLTAR